MEWTVQKLHRKGKKLLEIAQKFFPRASSSNKIARKISSNFAARNPLERAIARKCSELLENCSVLEIARSHTVGDAACVQNPVHSLLQVCSTGFAQRTNTVWHLKRYCKEARELVAHGGSIDSLEPIYVPPTEAELRVCQKQEVIARRYKQSRST